MLLGDCPSFVRVAEARQTLIGFQKNAPTTTTTTSRDKTKSSTLSLQPCYYYYTSFTASSNNTPTSAMSSFFAEIMQPGGGIILIPFVRVIITILLVLTMMGFVAGVARIHMGILSFLSAGLLFSLSMFEKEFNKVHGQQRGGSPSQASSTTTAKASNKTD
jgi:hypothetical protein